MTVKDLIGSRADVYSIPHDMTVYDAARYLRDRRVRSIGVLDGERLVGVVSQSDISDKVAAENKCPAWMRVTEIMSTRLVSVTSDQPITTSRSCIARWSSCGDLVSVSSTARRMRL